MKIIFNKNKLIKYIQKEKNLGLVPTMGALHLGYISLVKKCISQCNKTIVSIFINKPQINRKSDFQRYPKMLKKRYDTISYFLSLARYSFGQGDHLTFFRVLTGDFINFCFYYYFF